MPSSRRDAAFAIATEDWSEASCMALLWKEVLWGQVRFHAESVGGSLVVFDIITVPARTTTHPHNTPILPSCGPIPPRARHSTTDGIRRREGYMT